MLMFLRHLASFLALPFVVAGVVPYSIARRTHLAFAVPSDAGDLALVALGTLLLLPGVLLFASSLWQFVTRGRGTLAPWDPPRNLVVAGPYRYVRNPMISGVIFVLLAEASLLRSFPLFEWAVTFFIMNAIYIPLIEEPMLAARFGDDYRDYCAHVGRLVPRLRPWTRPTSV